MQSGEIIDSRFEIERLAGEGGMGRIYRALDLRDGERVALKVMHGADADGLRRFTREAEALAALRLPGVVRYVAHGVTANRAPYLAMAWLDGETLAERLDRAPLTVVESVTLVARVAETLAAVHRLGVVHRDLKPGNLMLEAGELDRVTLIDFGVARVAASEHQLTIPGMLLGTPGYIAPEQARGQPHVDQRADIFTLGCVLFRCLTGRPAFEGNDGLAVLTKVILEEPPRIQELRPEIPSALAELVARMLSKAPEQRPRDGAAAAAELSLLVGAAHGPAPSLRSGESGRSGTAPAASLTTAERRVMCLVLTRGKIPGGAAAVAASSDRARALAALATRYGARVELLDGRAPLFVLSGAGAATDLATRAARCALALRSLLGDAPVALATGRAELEASVPVGRLIDRAAGLLPQGADGAAAIRIDDVTAGLLGGRFEVAHDEGGFWLRATRDRREAAPQLLGRPTPCVGRRHELTQLEASLSHCIRESAASVMLVTGAAGMGKTRMRQEFLRAVRARSEPVEVWMGRADPISAGSAFSLLADALRDGLGLADGEPLDDRRRRIRARLARHPDLDVDRVAPFLGELVGAPFPDENDVQLRAARQDARLMGEKLRRAWEALLRAECAAQPVLLVLEDLHWGDLPTVTMVDAALRSACDLPLLVLALARPEVHGLMPELWVDHGLCELRLTPLSRKASEELARGALGEGTGDDLVAALVARADGNAFYLEELVRAAASGTSERLPETVLAMVQAGLETLDVEARRALRAASLFGESFRKDGVVTLVGGVDVAAPLAELVRREAILEQGDGAGGDVEYRFRHALVREAAYGMLTERDRQLGHALAGDFLERAGGADPMALAEHFERGAEPARAATAYLRAAEQALRGSDLAGVFERAQRGLACGGSPETLGALELVEAEARHWHGEYALAELRAVGATARLPTGSAAWFAAVMMIILTTSKLGDNHKLEQWTEAAWGTDARPGAATAKCICIAEATIALYLVARYAPADAMLEWLDGATRELSEVDAMAIAKLRHAQSIQATMQGDLGDRMERGAACLEAMERVGHAYEICVARVNLGFDCAELGDLERAETTLRTALNEAKQLSHSDILTAAHQNLGAVLMYQGRIEEARTVLETAVTMCQAQGHSRFEGVSRAYLARALLPVDAESAARESRLASEILSAAPPLRAFAFAVRARASLALGHADEALAAARDAIGLLNEVGAEEGEALVRLVLAEALSATGRGDEARAAIASARDHLLARAAKVRDPALRERFLNEVPDNARTLALALSQAP